MYKQKYLKYKNKYLQLKKKITIQQSGGGWLMPWHNTQLSRTDLILKEDNKEKGYIIYCAPEDNDCDLKIKGIKNGIDILIKSGIQLPKNLRFYLTPSNPINPPGFSGQIMTEAIQKTEHPNGVQVAIIFIADQRILNNRALSVCGMAIANKDICKSRPKLCPCHAIEDIDSISSVLGGISGIYTSSKKVADTTTYKISDHEFIAKVASTTIHEIGHILHERNAPKLFWDDSKQGMKVENADKISVYATDNWKEFIAETFTAMVMGYRLDSNVLLEYDNLGGPTVPKYFRAKSASKGQYLR